MQTEAVKPEAVDHPAHFQTAAGIDALDVIEGYGLGPHLAVAMELLLAAGRGSDYEPRLRKAIWYIERSLIQEARFGAPLYLRSIGDLAGGVWIGDPEGVIVAFDIDPHSKHAACVRAILQGWANVPQRKMQVTAARGFLIEAFGAAMGRVELAHAG